MSAPVPGIPRPSAAVRLTFAYEGGDVRVVDRRTVTVVMPPDDPLPDQGPRGVWIEVRGGQEQVLHRRVMDDPWRQDVEVFSPEPDANLSRVPVASPSGTFSVLVPAPAEADHVVLLGTTMPGVPSARAQAGDTPVELGRFPIRP